MTTKVVKGSIWTVAGQVAPLAISLVTTPLFIRLLGTEAYGAFILIVLIPTYAGFADFGMSLASTKYGSEAYSKGDSEGEASIVRTCALIAFLAAAPIAIFLFAFSYQIASLFNVPPDLLSDAALGLKLTAITFLINFFNNIFNTPQLSRLRMDLNTFITSGFRILGLLAAPLAVFLGYGIVGAAFVYMVASALTLVAHVYTSGRLLPSLYGVSINLRLLRPLLWFGGALVGAGIAAVLLGHLEKVVLVKTTSVEALAYYSLAFTLATMATVLSQAMIQSLIPAFSQLLAPENRQQLQELFSRSVRLILIASVPTLALLFVMAKSIFAYMGGDDFVRESTLPFRVLLFGLLFNVVAYTPYSLLMASGRSDIFAKIYWGELLPYLGLTAILTVRFGAVGAALAWSIRIIIDAVIIGWVAVRTTRVSFSVFKGRELGFVLVALLFLPSIAAAVYFSGDMIWPLVVLVPTLMLYTLLIWKNFIDQNEQAWIIGQIRAVTHR